MSLALGEPFIKDGLLHFYDGRVLTISAYPFAEQHSSLCSRVRQLTETWCRRARIDLVTIWSPERVSLSFLASSGFKRTTFFPPKKMGAEMIVDCTDKQLAIKHTQRVRTLTKCCLNVNAVTQPKIQASHMTLIEGFFSSIEMTAYVFDLVTSLHGLRSLGRIRWLEAFHEQKLCGLAAVHDAFDSTDLAIFLARDRDIPGVSDFLAHHIIDSSRNLGKRYVNLGPSPSKGIYRFKQKWGGQPKVPPYFYAEWGRGPLGRRNYSSWAARIISYRHPYA